VKNFSFKNNRVGSKAGLPVFLFALLSTLLPILIIQPQENLKYKTLAFAAFSWTALLTYLHGKKHSLIAFNAFFIFWLYVYAEKITYGSVSSQGLIAYMMLSVGIAFLFALLFQEARSRLRFLAPTFVFILCLLFYSIPIGYLIYYFTFKVQITPDVFFAIFQTSVREAFDFITDYISLKWLVLILIGSSLLSFGLYRKEKFEPKNIEVSLASFLIILSISASYANKTDLRLIQRIPASIQQYQEELAKFEKVRSKVTSGKIKYDAVKQGKGEVYVVVIGESLNKNQMQLYGYLRETTPNLYELDKKGELIRFDNAYSNHTRTMPVLSLSLTEANQINGKEYFSSPSIVDIVKTAGFETFWVTNQVLYGVWDNLVSIIAHSADHLVALNKNIGLSLKTQKYDEETIKFVDDILNERQNKKNKIIFVHLMGSHWHYCSRFTEKFSKYDGPLIKGDFGKLAENKDLAEWINCYDNSVLYNDHVVAGLLNLLKEKQGISGFIYIADHGEEVIQLKGHDPAIFTFDMAQIPLIAWFSDEYKNKYETKINALKNNRGKLFPNDLIYDTLIGLMGIKTDRYENKYDISNHNYSLNQDELFTLHGKQKYIDRDNYNYLQWKNHGELSKRKLLSRVIPTGINTMGKFKEAQFDGFDSFELDLIYRKDKGGYMEVGLDESSEAGSTLQDFLKIVHQSEGQKIWLNIKNLTPDNISDLTHHLLQLDKTYDLKGKVVIESETTEERFSKLSEAGFTTSYKLPKAVLLKLLSEGSEIELEKRAEELSRQIKRQKVKSISFDHKLFSFVENNLKKHLDAQIIFHTRDSSLSLKDENFMSHLISKPYFSNQRVKTIRVHYHSHFSL
jgi:heptose-I-phosphate ethanolaminephosphotransferase